MRKPFLAGGLAESKVLGKGGEKYKARGTDGQRKQRVLINTRFFINAAKSFLFHNKLLNKGRY